MTTVNHIYSKAAWLYPLTAGGIGSADRLALCESGKRTSQRPDGTKESGRSWIGWAASSPPG
jgi:hypothetical protein